MRIRRHRTLEGHQRGGICLITEAALEQKRILNLSFLLPQREVPLQCFGKVMWSRRATEHLYENGISFWEIKDKDRAEISDCLRSGIGTL